MGRTLRTLAAVLAGLALVAALPAPCGCAPQPTASRQAGGHDCCAPPTGVRATGPGCCDETPDATEAVPSPVGPDAVAPFAAVLPGAAPPSARRVLALPSSLPVSPPPPTVLRV